MKLIIDENNSSSNAIIYLYENIKSKVKDLNVEKSSQSLKLEIDNSTILNSQQAILKYLSRQSNDFYGKSTNETAEIDTWIDLSYSLLDSSSNRDDLFKHFNKCVSGKEFLVANRLTVADFALIGALKGLKMSSDQNDLNKYFSTLTAHKAFQSIVVSSKQSSTEGKDYSKEGKFVELPGAENGKVCVRFPPEASGFLHVGHAKAALLNKFYKDEYNGKMIFRFDDTNPAKENHEFEQAILADVKTLSCEYDQFTRTSDHFDRLLECCEKLIKSGKAYADDTDPEEMKKERDQQIESKNRNNSVEKNMKMWQEMVKGSVIGQKCCIRAKIDMKSNNGTMRDPTLYRCKPEIHTATGDKYKVYPTYDLACPVVDSIEGVTHALRTTEYHDRDEQYVWLIKALGLREPHIYEYSRFNLQNTVLSKRKLTWFVETGKVSGWDDPRMPTVRGIIRHGMTIEALKQFIIAQGSSRSVVQMEWDKIWTFNKNVIDPIAPRHNALLENKVVLVNVAGAVEESKVVAKHPKNSDVGTKTVWYGPRILIDLADAETIKEGEMVTFMDWGNLEITKVNRKGSIIESIDAKLCLENKDFKKTLKLTWLAQTPKAPFTRITCIHYDHIISKAVLDKEDDFKQYCNHQTQFDFDVLGDHEMKMLKKGDIIQIQRKGYYICDKEPSGGVDERCVLIYIPDGSKKEPPTTFMSITGQTYFTTAAANENVGNKKSPKDQIDQKVEQKLQLKESSKKLSGQDWKPDLDLSSKMASVEEKVSNLSINSSSGESLDDKIKKTGDSVRALKASKAAKEQIDKEVKSLLELKAEYKKQFGKDWTPEATPIAAAATVVTPQKPQESSSESLDDKIKKTGDSVRALKASKAAKELIDKEVKSLLELKAEYKKQFGKDWTPEATPIAAAAPVKPKVEKQAAKPAEDASLKKTTKLCLEAKKKENLPEWYSQLITKSELIEYYDVSGCYILRPWSYFIWEQIKDQFDANIKRLGVQNCYFPLFVSKAALEREKTHIADFAPEVAWVTKSGSTDLAEPIAVRPTSETVMYPAYAKWIQSYRDLPLKLNQWNNVVRWEFKHPQPFLRTREFLWQEGHTAFASYDEAAEEVYKILDLYADVYKSLLAVPVIKGKKTEKEKFAGADWTTTIEAYISASGRGIQAATSHHLGQNFSKMFDIAFEDPETQTKKFAFQNSWGLTTRSIGILAMVHGDDTGLVLPPKVACYQVVIVPCGITASLSKEDEKKLLDKCKWYEHQLREADVRVYGDYRDNYSPGWKFNNWELRGVPVRLEIGPKDLAQNKFVAVRRDTGVKQTLEENSAVSSIKQLLVDIHDNLYSRALEDLNNHIAVEDTWEDFLRSLDAKKIIMAPFCGGKECEDRVKKDSARDAVVEEGAPAMGAKSLCIPLDQPKQITNQVCFHPQCGKAAQYYTLFGRSY